MGQGPNTRSDSDSSMVPEAVVGQVHYTFSLFLVHHKNLAFFERRQNMLSKKIKQWGKSKPLTSFEQVQLSFGHHYGGP